MLYPKIKIKKTKRKEIISNYLYDIKSIIVSNISIFKGKTHFIMFIRKNFHF